MRQLHHADAIVLGVCAHVFVLVQPAAAPGQMRSMSVDLTAERNDSHFDTALPGGAGGGNDGSLGGFRPSRGIGGMGKGGSFSIRSVVGRDRTESES